MYASQSVKKKDVELWGSVSIYRGQKTLKNRHGWLGCESKRILLRKGQMGVPYHHPKAVGPKPKRGKFSPFRVPFSTPKVPNWLLDTEHSFVFGCCLDSSSSVFWQVLAPRCIFILHLWFFFLSLFWIIQAFF